MITIFILFASTIVMTDAFAQNDTRLPLNDLGDGNTFFMTVKGSFLPGQLVEINGNLVTVDPVQIVLDNPQGMIKASKTTFSDRDGHFASELKIPADAEAGNWTIVGTSGIYHKELNFTILGNSDTMTCYAGNLCSKPLGITSTHSVIHGMNLTILQSPLQQFKSGIAPNDVKCKGGFTLIAKASNNTPACVTLQTYYSLVNRGWTILQNTTTTAWIFANDTRYDIPYVIRGWNNDLSSSITFDSEHTSLIVPIKSVAEKGEITLTIPRSLLDSNLGPSMPFVVLVDGLEVKHTEVTSSTARMLTIPFEFGAQKIEIIAPQRI